MSKEFKNIDELFQVSFEGDTSEVPAFIKSNIDKRIAGNNKKAGWWKWGGLLSLFVVSGIAGIYFFGDQETNDQLLYNNDSNSEMNNVSSDVQHEINYENDSDLIIQEENAGTTEGENQNDNDNMSDPLSVSDNETNPNEKIPSENSKNDPVDNFKKTTVDNGTNPSLDDTQNGIAAEDKLNDSNDEKSSSIKMTDREESVNSPSIAGLNPRQFSFGADKNSILKNENRGSLNYPIQYPFNSLSQNVSANSVHKNETYNPWMISATGGVSLSESKYSTSNPNELTIYEDSNNDKPGFGFALNATCRLQNSLTFGTGVSMNTLAETYHYFKEDVMIDSTLTWTYQDIYEYDTLLDTMMWVGIDSSYTADYDTTKKVMYDFSGETKATYFSIPLSIGTQIITEKFRFDFYVAGRFNYLLKATGGYVMNDVYQMFTNSNQIFRKMYVDVILGANVHYKLTDHFYLSGTLKYKPALQEIYQGLDFNKSFQSIQIGAGVSWKF